MTPAADPEAEPLGRRLPRIVALPPGPRSRALAVRLAAVESRNVTYRSDGWPVFWTEARGANVVDADGNTYLDLTGAFGVALLGHRHPAVERAVAAQAARLVHGMGDVHPPDVKVELLERLAGRMPWDDARGVLASTGSEAVEIALKTAELATGRSGVVVLEGAYHGLTLGALSATTREHFRRPFARRLYGGVARIPWPEGGAEAVLGGLDRLLEEGAPNGDPVGAVLVEPVQGRAGVRIPPEGFMRELGRRARAGGAVVVADEILTGAGRCGTFLASERVGLEPDLVCVGKALGGGLPLSACFGRAEVMDAWPASTGEAVHTSTFLGHPLACAAALAVLDELEESAAPGRIRAGADGLLAVLRGRLAGLPRVRDVRGLGLLLGVELESAGTGDGAGAPPAVRVAEAALARGVLVLPAGERGEVVELLPPADLTDGQVAWAVDVLAEAVEALA